MARSLEVLLYNRRLRKNISTRLNLACVAWRFWLGALSNNGGRGQRNRSFLRASRANFAASPLVRPARRNRHATQTSLNQADRTDLPTSFTPQLNTPKKVTSNTPRRKRSRRKHTKSRPTNKTNAPLDTSSVVNLSNVTLTDNKTQLLARGLGFCPSPRHIDWTEVNADFDEFARPLCIIEFFS